MNPVIGRPLFLIVLVLWVTAAAAGDWPAFRHDIQRSAVTDEKLEFPLQPAWHITCAQPPAPAWRPITKAYNRMEFDYAPQPVIANGLLYFGSSADDTVRALDAKSGEERWYFIAGGPVRFAPQVVGDRIYFAADDGFVYCLDAATGKLGWSFRAAPYDDCLLGDGRMISRWPIRTGVLVDAGVVYAVAGMWPSEGVFVYALDAADGRVIWCNDTGGRPASWEIPKGREVFFFQSGLTPQGPLLANRDVLLVPMGRSSPVGFDRKTGRLLYFYPGAKYSGIAGTPYAMSDGQYILYAFTGRGKSMSIVRGNATQGGGGGATMKLEGTVPQAGDIR